MANSEKTDKLFEGIKSIETGSNKIITWSLSLLAGTLLAILSDSYLHPTTTNLKMIYLIFIPAWTFIGVSFYQGKEIIGRTIASGLYKENEEQMKIIFSECNNSYSKQIFYFNLALLFLGIWLFIYLIWWVFGDSILNIKC